MVATRKRADKDTDSDGSFLQLSEQTVSNVLPSATGNDTQFPDKSDAISAYLQKIDATNQTLIRRVGELETNKSVASNPQIPWSYPGVHSLASQTTLNLQYL